MLDRLATQAHRLRVLIETLLHSFKHVLVLPSCDAPLGSLGTLRFERAVRACRRPIAAQRLAVLLIGVTIGQLRPSGSDRHPPSAGRRSPACRSDLPILRLRSLASAASP